MLSCVVVARHHTHVRLAGSQACKWWDTRMFSPDILQVPVSWIVGFLRFDESLWLFRGKKSSCSFPGIIKRPWRPATHCNLKSSRQAPLHNIDLINSGMTWVLQTAWWKISLWCKHTKSGDDVRRHVTPLNGPSYGCHMLMFCRVFMVLLFNHVFLMWLVLFGGIFEDKICWLEQPLCHDGRHVHWALWVGQWEIGNAATESWVTFDHHCLVCALGWTGEFSRVYPTFALRYLG